MRVRIEDYAIADQESDINYETGEDLDFDLPECDLCDDHGCTECNPDDFAEMHLKWACDGSTTLEEAIESLHDFIADLRAYQETGFELTEPVDNSHFWLEKAKQGDQSSSSSAGTSSSAAA